jgi:uncharacterized protein YaeQ
MSVIHRDAHCACACARRRNYQDWLAALAAKLERRMTFSLTIAEQHVYLTIGADTLPCVIEKISLSG